MARQFLTSINLNLQEIQSVKAQNLGALPGGVAGQFCYYTTTNTWQYYNGTAWIDPLARANHSGTQLAATISNLAATVQTYALSSFAAPAANIAMAGFTLTGLGTPSASGQAAEYTWVLGQIQNAAAGISSKDPVIVVSVANQAALTGLPTVDGVTLTAGQRILLVGQTTAAQNGVYTVAAGAWSRSTLEGSTGELDIGATWLVLSGTVYGGSSWRVSNSSAITVGSTAVTIVQSSIGVTYSASGTGGLQLTGSSYSILLPASSGLVTSGTGLQIDTSLVVKKQMFTITGDGSTTTFAVTHALAGGLDVMVQVYEISSGATVETDVTRASTTSVSIGFAIAPIAAKTYRVILQG
jgi:hypothetical protein